MGNTPNIKSMEKAVMAIWHHSRSTDDEPDHHLCPSGETSWCGYNWDTAKGTADYSHQRLLPEAVADPILPVLESLSDQLLSRCLHGGTQNQNEAINALIWQRATKEAHSGLVVVEFTAVFFGCQSFQ